MPTETVGKVVFKMCFCKLIKTRVSQFHIKHRIQMKNIQCLLLTSAFLFCFYDAFAQNFEYKKGYVNGVQVEYEPEWKKAYAAQLQNRPAFEVPVSKFMREWSMTFQKKQASLNGSLYMIVLHLDEKGLVKKVKILGPPQLGINNEELTSIVSKTRWHLAHKLNKNGDREPMEKDFGLTFSLDFVIYIKDGKTKIYISQNMEGESEDEPYKYLIPYHYVMEF